MREVKKRRLEEVKKKVAKLYDVLDKIEIEEFVRLIREDREGRRGVELPLRLILYTARVEGLSC